jgi:hypothetical protein
MTCVSQGNSGRSSLIDFRKNSIINRQNQGEEVYHQAGSAVGTSTFPPFHLPLFESQEELP